MFYFWIPPWIWEAPPTYHILETIQGRARNLLYIMLQPRSRLVILLACFFPSPLVTKTCFCCSQDASNQACFFSTPKISYNRTAHVFFFKGIYDFFTHTHKIELYIHINIYDCKSLTEDGKFRPITIFLYLNELPDNSGVRSPRMRLGIGYYTLQDQLT